MVNRIWARAYGTGRVKFIFDKESFVMRDKHVLKSQVVKKWPIKPILVKIKIIAMDFVKKVDSKKMIGNISGLDFILQEGSIEVCKFLLIKTQ